MAETLLDAGADVNAISKIRQHTAAESCPVKVVKMFLDAGILDIDYRQRGVM
jgi:hypothetical protein